MQHSPKPNNSRHHANILLLQRAQLRKFRVIHRRFRPAMEAHRPKPQFPILARVHRGGLSSPAETSASLFAGASDPVPRHAASPLRANSAACWRRQISAAKTIRSPQQFENSYRYPRHTRRHFADSTAPPALSLASAPNAAASSRSPCGNACRHLFQMLVFPSVSCRYVCTRFPRSRWTICFHASAPSVNSVLSFNFFRNTSRS